MLDNLDSKQKKILIIVGIVIIIGIIFFIYNKDSNDEKILDENMAERHIRGGMATRLKYSHERKNNAG